MVFPPQSSNTDEEQLKRLLKARANNALALEAQNIAKEQEAQRIQPQNIQAQQATQSIVNSRKTPLEPETQGFWSKLGSGAKKTLETIAIPGEISASLAVGLFDKDLRKERTRLRGLTEEEDFGAKIGDFLMTSREAYKEKDLPLWATLPLEIVTDPLNLIPGAILAKPFVAAFKGTKAVTKITPKVFSSVVDSSVIHKNVAETVEATASGKVNNFLAKSGIYTTLIKPVLGKFKGYSNVLDQNDDFGVVVANLLGKEARRDPAVVGSLQKIKPMEFDSVAQKYIPTSRTVDNMFQIDEVGNIKTLEGVGEGADGIFWGRVFEDAYRVEGNLDDAASVFKRADGSSKKWLELNPDELETFLNPIYKGKLDVVQKKGIANVIHQVDEVADMTEGMNVAFSRLVYEGADVGRKVVPRKVIFKLAQKVFDADATKRLGRKPASQKKRAFDNSELDDVMQEAIDNGAITYSNSISGTMGAYLKGAYKTIDEAVLAQETQALYQKGSKEILFSANKTARNVVFKTLNSVAAKGNTFTKSQLKTLNEVGFNDLTAIIRGGGKVDKKTGQLIRKLGGKLEDQITIEKEAFQSIKEAAKKYTQSIKTNKGTPFGKDDAVRTIPREGQELPGTFNQIFFTGKNAKKTAEKFRRLVGTADASTFENLSQGFGGIGDILRVGKTGFDIGFMVLQGLPMLGAAFFKPKLFGAWAKAASTGIKAFGTEAALNNVLQDASRKIVRRGVDDLGNAVEVTLLDDMIENGVQLGRQATDIYQGIGTAGRLARTVTDPFGKAGEVVRETGEKTVGSLLKRFERSFTASSDVLRIKGYEALRETALKSDDLAGLATFLNKSTGALSAVEAGIPPSQRALERGFLFFSPKYTRSSLGLLADVTRGGVRGDQARKSLVGMAGVGMGIYHAYATALGQEIHLDPRDSKFMTVEINGNRVGVGSFWTSFARFIANTADNAFTDEDIFEEQKGNPLINWLRGRGAPTTGLIRDITYGTDFLGRPIDSKLDMAKHLGKSILPFSVESMLQDNPHSPSGWANIAERTTRFGTEFLGLRVRPNSIWERRNNERDKLAQIDFGKKYEDLNRLQQTQLTNNYEILQIMDKDAKKVAGESAKELPSQVEMYYYERDRINKKYSDQTKEIYEYMLENPNYTTREFRDKFLKKINAERRLSFQDLKIRTQEGGDLGLVDRYFTDLAVKFDDESQPEDIAYDEFIDQIIANNDYDRVEGYDWSARDEAVESFRNRWGDEVYDYVQQRLEGGKKLHPLQAEYYNQKKKYEFYFESSEKAVIQSEADPEYAQSIRRAWINGTPTERLKIEEQIPYARTLKNKISRVRKALRQQNPGVDAFLYRWGYTGKLIHNQNIGEEDFWHQPGLIDPEVYEQGAGLGNP
tara:strand:+ start:4700 stop:8860 length:4161 start_codon:yes stop_codon:yes gene_type:complete